MELAIQDRADILRLLRFARNSRAEVWLGWRDETIHGWKTPTTIHRDGRVTFEDGMNISISDISSVSAQPTFW